ncbi:MAG: 5-formyltetrahydrofolate cyclo-ligase [bacterium]
MILDEITQKKQSLRRFIAQKRASLSHEWVVARSRTIFHQLPAISEFEAARTIHCYVAWKNEVDTHALIKNLLAKNRTVVVPVVNVAAHTLFHSQIRDFDELRPGAYGILEPPADLIRPVEVSCIDLVIVPGVAFDRQGNRLGYGGGFYDAFLSQITCKKIGLAFEFQVLDSIPTRSQDMCVDRLVTEKGIYDFQQQRP